MQKPHVGQRLKINPNLAPHSRRENSSAENPRLPRAEQENNVTDRIVVRLHLREHGAASPPRAGKTPVFHGTSADEKRRTVLSGDAPAAWCNSTKRTWCI